MLREVLEESREFSRRYAAAVERSPKVKKLAEIPDDGGRGKPEIFTSNTPEFEDAIGKISKGLLAVLDSQFGSRPQTFVAGGIIDEHKEKKTDSASIEDESVLEVFEEEDSE